MRLALATGLILSISPVLAVPAAEATPGVMAAYTLVVPSSVAASNLQVRAVIPTGGSCPKVKVTKKSGKKVSLAMALRSPSSATGAAFAGVRVCQANLPASAKSATVGGVSVPASLPETYDEIALIGDTGCRVTTKLIQDCSTTAGWPLGRNARSLAKEKPDMVLFTGDFYYREAPCPPADQAKCGTTPPPLLNVPFKDSTNSWMADVFLPMSPMLQAAPILAVRGNHEACHRGGNGFFLFFDAGKNSAGACAPVNGEAPENMTEPWAFDMPITGSRSLRAVIVDTANGEDEEISPWVTTQKAAYQKADSLTKKKKGWESWLVAHRPMFGVEATGQSSDPAWQPWTALDQTAAGIGLIANYDLLVSSHVHVAQVVQIPEQAPQLIVGNGGSIPQGDGNYSKPQYGPLVGSDGQPISPDYQPYPNASYFWNAMKYGYTIATPGKRAGQWTFAQKDITGQQFATCKLASRSMKCS